LGNYAIAKPTPLVICSSELFRFVLSGNSAHPCKVWIHRRRARGGARNERPDPYRAVCGPVTPRPQTPIMYIMSGTTVWCIRREPPNGNELPAAQRCRQRRRSWRPPNRSGSSVLRPVLPSSEWPAPTPAADVAVQSDFGERTAPPVNTVRSPACPGGHKRFIVQGGGRHRRWGGWSIL